MNNAQKNLSLSAIILLLSMLIYGCYSNSALFKHLGTAIPAAIQFETAKTPLKITPTPSLLPDMEKTIIPKTTPNPTAMVTITAPALRNPNQKLPENWFIEEYQFPSKTSKDPYAVAHFYENVRDRHQNDLGLVNYLNIRFSKAIINSKPLTIETIRVCKESNPKDCSFHTIVRQDGINIYEVDHGKSFLDPFALVPHSWVYDGKWMLEVRTTNGNESCSIENIILNGVSINEKFNYTRSFNGFIIEGKPFYFYERDDAFGFAYDFVEYPLDYSDIWYACCCGAADSNPELYEFGLLFGAEHNGNNLLVVIGKISSP